MWENQIKSLLIIFCAVLAIASPSLLTANDNLHPKLIKHVVEALRSGCVLNGVGHDVARGRRIAVGSGRSRCGRAIILTLDSVVRCDIALGVSHDAVTLVDFRKS